MQIESSTPIYSSVEYEGWWDRSVELHDYLLNRMPQSMADRVGMGKQRKRLLKQYKSISHPDALENIQEGEAGALQSWIRSAETLIHYVVQNRSADGATEKKTTTKLELVDDPAQSGIENDWHWPWLDGWDDPKNRERILHPPKEKTALKKVLVIGGIAAAALYVGKRIADGGDE